MKKKKRYVIFFMLCIATSIFLQGSLGSTHTRVEKHNPPTYPDDVTTIDENHDPYISFFIGPNTRQVNQPVIIFVIVRDPDVFEKVRVSIWWRDGDWEMTPYKISPGIFFISHIYTKKGTYEVRAFPWDEHNTLGTAGTCPITII